MPKEVYLLEGLKEDDIRSIYKDLGEGVIYKFISFHKDPLDIDILPNASRTSISDEQISSWLSELFQTVKDLTYRYAIDHAISDSTLQFLYSTKFKLYFTLQAEYLQYRFIQKEQKSNAVFYSPYSIDLPNTHTIQQAQRQSNTRKIFSFVGFSIFIMSRLFLGLFKKKRKRPVIIYSNIFSRTYCLEPENLNSIYLNPHLEFLTRDSDDFQLAEDCGASTKPLSRYFQNLLPETHYSDLFEFHLIKVLLNPFNWHRLLKKKNVLRNEIRQLTAISKNDLDKILWNRIQSFDSLKWLYILRYQAASVYFKANTHVELIVTVAENSSIHKPILDAAKDKGIHTFGIQHGTIHNFHPHYMWHPSDRYFHPYPDLTLLWGPYWKERLVNDGHMPEDKLKVLGHMQSDVVYKVRSKKDQKSTTHVLFASQPIKNKSYRDQTWNDVIKAFGRLSTDIKLFIRPHPKEIDSHYLLEQIGKLKSKNIPFELCQDIDLYELFTNIDVLIVAFSTVAVEAQYFYMDVITLDYDELDRVGLLKKGIAVNAKSPEDIISLLQRKCKGAKLIKPANQASFIKRLSHPIDGERVKAYKDFLKNYSAE